MESPNPAIAANKLMTMRLVMGKCGRWQGYPVYLIMFVRFDGYGTSTGAGHVLKVRRHFYFIRCAS